ncbi:KaiC [uncultured archaeon]|nr:KaiC [uncultured archaeon]
MNRNHDEKDVKSIGELMAPRAPRAKKANDEAAPRKGSSVEQMFPKKVLLFSAMPFTTATKTPYRLAYNYLATTKEKKLIWVATDQPAEKVPDIFKEYGMDIGPFKDRIFFVDLVSSGAGVKSGEKSPQVHYVENADNMVEVSMLLADLFDDKLVDLAVIDSINGLLAFNKPSAVTKLIRFIPVIAEKTDTTILLVLMQGEFGADMEHAIQVTADALLSVDKDELVIKKRTSVERINL